MPDDPSRGLYGKYLVERVDGKPLKGGRCIVLEVGDPTAWPALSQWAETVHSAGYLDLAADVRRLLIEAREAARSTETWRHADGSVRTDHMDARPGDYFGRTEPS